MSTEHSESRGSGQTPVPEQKVPLKPPFKVCFPKHQMNGRSDVGISKIDATFITPKFYSRGSNENANDSSVKEMVEQRIARESKGPRDFHRWPLLNSQSYGWWYDRRFDSRDSRFNFHKNTSDMVQSRAIIQCEDRKLRGLSN